MIYGVSVPGAPLPENWNIFAFFAGSFFVCRLQCTHTHSGRCILPGINQLASYRAFGQPVCSDIPTPSRHPSYAAQRAGPLANIPAASFDIYVGIGNTKDSRMLNTEHWTLNPEDWILTWYVFFGAGTPKCHQRNTFQWSSIEFQTRIICTTGIYSLEVFGLEVCLESLIKNCAMGN